MIVRRESGQLKRYVHLSTGNYHSGTARVYTDYGLLSADPELGADVHEIFLQLTSMMETTPLQEDLPGTVRPPRQDRLEHIESEIRSVEAGGTGHIIAKDQRTG